MFRSRAPAAWQQRQPEVGAAVVALPAGGV